MSFKRLISTGFSTRKYYKSLNQTYKDIYGKHMMLHYPLYKDKNESLERRQLNLTDYCLSLTDDLSNKTVLEVGCGNGIQSKYFSENFDPRVVIGIDLNPDNIRIAKENSKDKTNLHFFVDDAHKLDQIADNSIDIVFCIESAFHYPQKELFLKQIERVLKHSGKFIIADIINKSSHKSFFWGFYRKNMCFHHWTEQQYIHSFNESNLNLEMSENITPLVMKGYQGHMRWIGRLNFKTWLRYQMFKLFVIIQVSINMYLLRRKENYLVLVGGKV
jgi:ubiquinone/menaquinone biosynthesis C-methylase UbiE